ncbi:PFL family protein [Clostridium sp.]|uniref:PFL family protein n=1 Tax=Clostridium sp. TaxID=1506 RepID=UPI0025C1204E|nr:PFL family protein [Clostridium sp.]MCI9070417.1 PFL family protein [Clostridium sp.]
MNANNILETIKMIEEEKLDIRTITMGISLLDCIDSNGDKAREKIYNKVTTYAKDLVKVGNEISNEFGIPIVNKRVSVTPISIIAGATDESNYIKFAEILDKAAHELKIDFIGGFSALVHKGYTKGDRILINSIPEALAKTNKVCSSVNVGSSKCGINMDAVKEMGKVIKKTAELTADKKGFGCAKLVVFANAVEDNPFMAGAFHGVGEADRVINVGVSGPGVVQRAIEKVKGESFDVVSETIKRTAFKITRIGQLVAHEASKRLDTPFGIVDLSLAPTPAVGDSVAHILEAMGLEVVGTHGTTAALALLNDAVKKGGVMACSHVGGLSGAFIPVSEDAGMIDAVLNNSLNLEKLEAMTAICSVGLDMIAVPGDTTAETLSAIIADESAIGVINNKTTAVRIIPAPNCKVGDLVEFGGLLGTAPVMAVNKHSSFDFINRGGRIPAPIHSFKN